MKKSAPKKIFSIVVFILLLFFVAASISLCLYIYVFQVNTDISLKRLLASLAVGTLFTLAAGYQYYRTHRLIDNKNFYLKNLFLTLVFCGIFWLFIPIPANYLLAPQTQLRVTIQRTPEVEQGITQISYLNNGLIDFSPEGLTFSSPKPEIAKNQKTTLLFDTSNVAQFSWQGRAWKSILIVLDSTQPVQISVNSQNRIDHYNLNSNDTLNLTIPVRNNAYYLLVKLLSMLATFVSLFCFVGLVRSLLIEKPTGQLELESVMTPGIKTVNTFLWVFFGLISLAVVFIGFTNRLYSDDYCYIYKLESVGFFNAITHYFNHFNGRYSSHVLDFLAYSFPQVNTVVGPLTVVIMAGGSLFFLFSQLFSQYQRTIRFKVSAFVTLALVGSFFMLVPFLYESFIWNIHAIIVSGGFAFSCIACGLFIRNSRIQMNKQQVIIWSTFFLIWGLAGAGFAEVTTELNIVLVGISIFVLFLNKSNPGVIKSLIFQLAFLFGNGIGLITLISAPASSQRMSLLFSANIKEFLTFLFSMLQTSVSQILNAKGYVPILVFVLVISSGFFWGHSLPSPLKWAKKDYSFIEKTLLLISPVIVYIFAFLPLAFFKGYFPERTLAIPVCFTLTTAMIVAIIFGNSYNLSTHKKKVLQDAILLLMIIASIPTSIYLLDFSKNMVLHQKEWDLRHQQLVQAVSRGDKEFVVIPYDHPMGIDLSNTENLWLQTCVTNYYGINVVVDDK